MKICVISTNALKTPPDAYGGIELQAWLTVMGLSSLGHTVHLIAKEGSETPPRGALFIYGSDNDLWKVVSHVDWTQRPDCWIDETHNKILTGMHPEFPQLSRYEIMSLMGNPHCPVLISEGQRHEKFNDASWPIIPQSIDLDVLPLYTGQRENYLLYLGQKIREKRVGWACEIAVRTNTPLYIHGPGWSIDPEIEEYARKYPDLIHNEGEVGGAEKLEKLQHAKALLHFPGAMGWSEAGGIVVLEALAVGTPCVVSRNGCLPEYMGQQNGFVADSVEEAIDAIQKVDSIHPEDCRKSVEKHDFRIVAHQYEEVCQRIILGERWR